MEFGVIVIVVGVVFCGLYAYIRLRKQSDKLVRHSHPSDAIAAKHGYTVVEDVEPSLGAMKDVVAVAFTKLGETSISGKEMRKRAVELNANAGMVDGQNVLDNLDEVSPEIREISDRYIWLTGTLLSHPNGNLYIACLVRCEGRWKMGFLWLDARFIGYDRLLRFK